MKRPLERMTDRAAELADKPMMVLRSLVSESDGTGRLGPCERTLRQETAGMTRGKLIEAILLNEFESELEQERNGAQ